MSVISTSGKVCGKPEQAIRCRGCTQERATERTTGTFADGFLRNQFLPLYEPSGDLPGKRQTESGFFRSMSQLSVHYGFIPMDVSGKPYPYNVLLAYWHAKQQLNIGNPEIELYIGKGEREKITLISKKTYNAAGTLYYIPVIPLFRLLKDRHQKICTELLMSVFSYLHRIAGVPYFRDSSTVLYYYYDMVKEWFIGDLESWEEPDRNRNISEINEAEYYGSQMFRKICTPYHLEHFKERIDKFKAKNSFQHDSLLLARAAYELFFQYPDCSIFGRIIKTEDERDEGIGRAEQYISFIANNEGWLFDSITQMVNDDLNECGDVEEPSVVRVFGEGPVLPDDGLDFEQRLFPLISDLCSLLNQIS